ncbi:MAG: ubiquitin-like protein, partial [Candidatus Fonsibacter sp.]
MSSLVVTRSEAARFVSNDADHNTQLQYIKKLLDKGKNFLIVPLDDDDNDDSDDEAEEEEADPLDTEESRLTTEDDVPEATIGQMFVKTLAGNTITVSDVTTKTKVIDIKRAIEENDGIPPKFQRLIYQHKKLKDNHTVGYYNMEKHDTIRMVGRLRGGGGKKVIKTIVNSKSTENTVDADRSVYEKEVMNALELHKATHINFKEMIKAMSLKQFET